MSEKLKKVVEMFNDGEWDELEPHFETIENFLRIVDKAGLTEMIDPFNDDIDEPERNELLYGFLQTSKSKEIIDEIIKRYFGDISVENGKLMLDFRNRDDLSDFFSSSRSRDYDYSEIAKRVLSGEHEDYNFWDTTDNVYRDVVEELNPENLNYFKQKVLKELEGQQIELDGRSSDWMDEEAKRQGHEEYIIIDNSNIDNVIKDEDTMIWLFKNDLDDINSNLYSIHRISYETAYSDEIYEKVINELRPYFVWENQDEYKYGDRYRFKVEVKYDVVVQVIEDFLYNWKGYERGLDYHGSFEGLFKDYLSEGEGLLTFRVPDYADSTLVDKYVNEYFGDYL